MPSTYTLNNGIELIGTGEQSGTWGDTTNTNFDLVDTALDGQVSIALSGAGSSGSPNDLPISDGATSNGRNRMITFTDGTDLGATAFVQLTPNNSEKIIYVRNNLRGSRSIILFQGTYNASNDYEVPAGTTAVVYFDGAGSGAVAANVFNNANFDALNVVGNATVGGTLGVTGVLTTTNGITMPDNAKAIFGAGSDLQIYHSGSNSFIDEVGTGNLYLRSSNLYIQNRDADPDEMMISAIADGAVTLSHNGSSKIATTATGISVTGDVQASDDIHLTSDQAKITFGADSEVELFHSADSGLTVSHTSTADNVVTGLTIRSNQATLTDGEAIGRLDFTTNTSAGSVANGVQARINIDATATYSATLAGSRMEFATTKADGSLARSLYIDDEQNAHLDDDKKLILGTGSDLQIYHDGSDSYVSDQGTGNLRIIASNLRIGNAAQTANYILANDGAGVTLNYSGAAKLATSATGIAVTGGFTATNGSTITTADNSTQLELISTDSDASVGSIFSLYRNSASPADGDDVGQIKFNAENSAGEKILYADILAELGDVTDGTEDGHLSLRTVTAGTVRRRLKISSAELVINEDSIDSDFRVESNTLTHALFVQGSDGKVGIGKSVPTGHLHVNSGATNTVAVFHSTDAVASIYLTDSTTTGGEGAAQGLFTTGNNLEVRGLGKVILATGTTDQLTVLSDGKVGIAFDDPQHKLDVNGTGRFVKTNNSQNLILETTDIDASSGPVLELYRNPGQAGAVSDALGEIRFDGLNAASEKTQFAEIITSIKDPTNGSEDGRLQINLQIAGANSQVFAADGAIGEIVINDSSKDMNFRVESNNDQSAFFVDGATGSIGISSSNPDTYKPQTHNADKRTLLSESSVGPQVVLWRNDGSIAQDDYIGGYLFRTSDASGPKYGGMIAKGDDGTGNGILEFYPVNNSYDSSDTVEGLMQLTDTNDLYLRAGKIQVGRSEKNVYTTSEESVTIFHNESDTYTQIVSRGGTGGDPVFRHQQQGAVKSEIEENGDFLSATDSYGAVSDGRLKENIVDSGSQWDDIKALQIKKYSFIDAELDAPNMIGVIAQDLLAAGMTGLVKQKFKTNADDEPILDADGNHDYIYTVKSSVMQMKAIKALQEAMTKIETLEARVTALET